MRRQHFYYYFTDIYDLLRPVEYRDNGNVVCGDTVIYFDYLIRDYDNNATIKILEETK